MANINGASAELTAEEAEAALCSFAKIITYPTVSSTAAADGGKNEL
jgi:hypothetical protein